MSVERIDVGDLTLAVELAGPEDAPAVLLLHGFPFTHEMWAAQVEALSGRWRVVAPDVRGHGGSDAGDGQYAIDFFVDDAVGLLDRLGIERAVGCGLSMGGYVLLRALERVPGRFRGAVLADTRSAADDDEGRLKRVAAVRSLKRKGAEAYAEQFVDVVLGRTTLEKRPEVADEVRRMIRANSVLGMCGAQLAMACRTDTTGVLDGLEVPALVIVGEEDTLTPRDVAGDMAERIPDARLAVIPRAGHLSAMERPGEFNRVLVDFLDELDGRDEPAALPPGEGVVV